MRCVFTYKILPIYLFLIAPNVISKLCLENSFDFLQEDFRSYSLTNTCNAGFTV